MKNKATSNSPAKQAGEGLRAGDGPAPGRGKWGFTWLLLALTAVMLALIFPPFYCFFLAPVALVPLCLCITRRPMHWRYAGAYYLCGAAFFLPNLFWIEQVDIFGFICLGLYLAVYFPVFAFALHRLVNGLRVPAIIAVPVAWTAVEYVRATFVQGGFPWFVLGNSFARAPVMIQTADLFGVWGVTFFIALLNGLVVDLLRLPLKKKGRFNIAIGREIAAGAVVTAFVIVYGVFRMQQKTISNGPRVAVIQDNIPQRVKDDPSEIDNCYQRYLKLARQASAADPAPDLVAWPETMIPGPINVEWMRIDPRLLTDYGRAQMVKLKADDAALRDLASSTGAAQLVGVPGLLPRRDSDIPLRQNLAILYLPETGPASPYYAKHHLVPFGEYLPFSSLPIVGKYMVRLMPYGIDPTNAAGTEWTRFRLPVTDRFVAASQPGQSAAIVTHTRLYTFGTPICFEDTMPEPARMLTAPRFSDGSKADFLVNVSNDGWFRSAELDQRLQASQLRAVENRVPIARAVNTGNSGFVDSCGRILKLVTGADGESIGAVGTASMVLPLDSRVSLFSRIGDLLPMVCGIAAVLGIAWTFVRPRRRARGDLAGPKSE